MPLSSEKNGTNRLPEIGEYRQKSAFLAAFQDELLLSDVHILEGLHRPNYQVTHERRSSTMPFFASVGSSRPLN